MKNILIPRRLEDRAERHKIITQRKIQEYIKKGSTGDLNLRNAPIEKLPDNLISIGGGLDMQDSKIKDLNNLESVGGSLDLENSLIESMGHLKTVGGYLFLGKTPISEKYSEVQIRKMIKVKRSIYMTD